MKRFYAYAKPTIILTFLLLMYAGNLFAQRTLTPVPNVNIDIIIKAFYESLPNNYTTTKRYPLIVFFHGANQWGDGSLAGLQRVSGPGNENRGLLQASLPQLIAQGLFPDGFTVNGEYLEPIVFIPQTTDGAASGGNDFRAHVLVNNAINYALARYSVDTTRIYLMGISMGGGFTFWGAGHSVSYARRLAGIVTLSAAGKDSVEYANNMATANLPVLAISSQDDGWHTEVSKPYVDAINASPILPDTAARLVTLPGNNHAFWEYPPYSALDYQFVPGRNIYQWMLSQQRVGAILPVVLEEYKVTASSTSTSTRKATITWSTSYEQNNAFFTIERSPDGSRFSTIGKVPAAAQGRGNSYTYTDFSPLDGSSYYRLSQTDLDGTVKYFDAKPVSFSTAGLAESLKIYPNPVSDFLVLEVANNLTGVLNATVISPDGKILRSNVFSKPDRFLRKTIDIGTLGRGVYMLKITGDNYLSVQRFIKD